MFFKLFSCCCWGTAVKKSPCVGHFKSDRDEIWQDCSSRHRWQSRAFNIFIFNVILSRWRPWRPLAAAYAATSAGCPLARQARVTSWAHCMCYSSWSIVLAVSLKYVNIFVLWCFIRREGHLICVKPSPVITVSLLLGTYRPEVTEEMWPTLNNVLD